MRDREQKTGSEMQTPQEKISKKNTSTQPITHTTPAGGEMESKRREMELEMEHERQRVRHRDLQ